MYDRPVEIRTVDARGLPRENYLKVRKGYQKLVDDGCVVVLGPMISDNSVNLRDLINATGVACIGWTGAVRFDGEYCFTVANGDIPTESVMGANWCFQQGYEGRLLLGEGLVGHRLRRLLPHRGAERRRRDHQGGGARPQPAQHAGEPGHDAGAGRRGHRLHGLRLRDVPLRAAFKALDWDPPRFMGTAFMFYSNSNEWAQGLEGWHGVDQLGEDGANPNYEAMLERFETRASVASRATSSSRSPTTRRGPAIHGIANATIAIPSEVKLGLEKIKWMPCTNGGPATYLTFAPYDHRGYKGDFLVIRELRGASCTSAATTARSGRRTPALRCWRNRSDYARRGSTIVRMPLAGSRIASRDAATPPTTIPPENSRRPRMVVPPRARRAGWKKSISPGPLKILVRPLWGERPE